MSKIILQYNIFFFKNETSIYVHNKILSLKLLSVLVESYNNQYLLFCLILKEAIFKRKDFR